MPKKVIIKYDKENNETIIKGIYDKQAYRCVLNSYYIDCFNVADMLLNNDKK